MKSRKHLENRLILHLSKYSAFKNRFALPFEITQDGIAKELGILRNHVPSLVKSLENKGLIYEKKARVVGAKNRRKTYFLTEKGTELAKKLSEKQESDARKSHIPKVDLFFGRDEEMKELKKWLRSGKHTILVTGMEGIGKTTLIAEFTRDLENVFWYCIKHHSSPESFLKELRLWSPWAVPEIKEVDTKSEKVKLFLSRALSNNILVMDNLQNASQGFMNFIAFLTKIIENSEKGKLILISPFVPDFLPKNSKTIRLGPMDKSSFIKLAEKRGAGAEAEVLYEKYGGNPSMLFFYRYEEKSEKFDMTEALMSMYSPQEIKIMEVGALYEEPMDFSAFLLEKDTGYESFIALVKKGIIETYEGQKYALSSIIKNFLRNEMSTDRKTEIWKEIGDHLSERGDVHFRIMAAMYLSMSGDYRKAKDVIVEVARAAITGGYEEELKTAVEMLPEKWRDADIFYIMGNISEIRSQWEEALRYYAKAEEMFRKKNQVKKMAESIRKQGSVLREMDRLDEAMDRYSIALRISKNKEVKVKIYDNMGTLELVRGNLEAGKKYIERAMEYAKKTGNKELVGLEYNSMGNVYLSMGKWSEAEEAYLNAISRLEDCGNRRMLSIALNNLAISYYKQLKLRKASMYWKKSASLSREMKDISFIYSEVNRSIASLKTGNLADAEEGVIGVLDVLSGLGGYSRVRGAALSILGHIEKFRGNFEEALKYYKKALSERRRAEDRKSALSSEIDIAEIYVFLENLDEAEKRAKKAMNLAKKSDFIEESTKASILLASILYRKGLVDEAMILMESVLELKEYGNRELEGRVYMEMGRILSKKDLKSAIMYLEKAEKLLKPIFIDKHLLKIIHAELMRKGARRTSMLEESRKKLINAGLSEKFIDIMTYV